MPSTPGALFSASQYRSKTGRKNFRRVVLAVIEVMKQELVLGAQLRWGEKLDAILGESIFDLRSDKNSHAQPRRPVKVTAWIPAHPNIARLMLNAFQHCDDVLPDGKPLRITATTVGGRTLSKLVSKRAVEWTVIHHPGGVESTGELTADQLSNEYRFQRVVSRASTDLIAYLHSVACTMRPASGDNNTIVLELQRGDERMAGADTKGDGLISCEQGWRLVERAIAQTASMFEVHTCPECQSQTVV